MLFILGGKILLTRKCDIGTPILNEDVIVASMNNWHLIKIKGDNVLYLIHGRGSLGGGSLYRRRCCDNCGEVPPKELLSVRLMSRYD